MGVPCQSKKEYHAIYMGGNKHVFGGRTIAGIRLRTEAKKSGYETLVVDMAPSLTRYELKVLLESVVSEKTLVIGFSLAWIDTMFSERKDLEWLVDDFFEEIKEKFSNVKIVCGGQNVTMHHRAASVIYSNSEWFLLGYSDIAFVKLLDYLSGKPNHNLKFFIEPTTKKKIVESNTFYKVQNPNDLETVFELEDNFLPHQPLPLEVGRGCIFSCSFCSVPFKGAKDFDSYQRTPENIARELKRNYDLFGTIKYTIMDDTFNDSMEKLDKLHKAIDIAKLPSFEFTSYLKPELITTRPDIGKKLKDLGVVGGFIGIESMNSKTRKAITKGMDFERMADAIKLFRQDTNAKIEGSFIVGLPHDSIENQFKTLDYMKSNRNEFCIGWHFTALGMFVDRFGKGVSEIDNNPEKFGYKIIRKLPESNNRFGYYLDWENDYTNHEKAGKLTDTLNLISKPYKKIAGWLVPTAWHVGYSSNVIEQLLGVNLAQMGADFERERAIEFLKKHTTLYQDRIDE
jgi:hypothetical protein